MGEIARVRMDRQRSARKPARIIRTVEPTGDAFVGLSSESADNESFGRFLTKAPADQGWAERRAEHLPLAGASRRD